MPKPTDQQYFDQLQKSFHAAMANAGGAERFEPQPGGTLGAAMDVRPHLIVRALTWVMAMTIAQYAEGDERRRDVEDQHRLLDEFIAIADRKLAAFRAGAS
ncbi:hypothetical protein FHS96_003737 [Sphingomonas zeicaulis]|uniref:hypothetical protein n=1 Tax=Sphingomonas zeicaulis TaxID=1632740 RepID=UPI003D25EF06